MSPAAASKDPTLLLEHTLFDAGWPMVIGVDEVGRGAIAGPVAVGVHAIPAGTIKFPPGLRDSKLLSEKRRILIAPEVELWGTGAVGYASPAEIDAHGISWALGQAARRALLLLHEGGTPVAHSMVILDGSHDWLTPVLRSPLHVQTRVGADRDCASVAAASVRAKVDRDKVMCTAHEEFPGYSWNSNKGYGSKAHYAGLKLHGVTDYHRRTWIRGLGTV